MQVKAFTLRFDPRIGGFDDSALCQFLADVDRDGQSLRSAVFQLSCSGFSGRTFATAATRNPEMPQ